MHQTKSLNIVCKLLRSLTLFGILRPTDRSHSTNEIQRPRIAIAPQVDPCFAVSMLHKPGPTIGTKGGSMSVIQHVVDPIRGRLQIRRPRGPVGKLVVCGAPPSFTIPHNWIIMSQRATAEMTKYTAIRRGSSEIQGIRGCVLPTSIEHQKVCLPAVIVALIRPYLVIRTKGARDETM